MHSSMVFKNRHFDFDLFPKHQLFLGILLLILFQSINYSYSRYVPGENSGARKSSRKKGTLMILIKVIIISMFDGIKFSLSLIIIIAMPEDTFYYL